MKRLFAHFAAYQVLVLSLTACQSSNGTIDTILTKRELLMGGAGAPQLCAKFNLPDDCDLCLEFGWYADCVCDNRLIELGFCVGPDPDCVECGGPCTPACACEPTGATDVEKIESCRVQGLPIPAGTWNISEWVPTLIDGNIVIEGIGSETILRQTGDASGVINIDGATLNAKHVTIRNLAVDGNRSLVGKSPTKPNRGIFLSKVEDLVIDKVTISNCAGHGATFSGIANVVIGDLTVSNNDFYGLEVVGNTSGSFGNLIAWGNGWGNNRLGLEGKTFTGINFGDGKESDGTVPHDIVIKTVLGYGNARDGIALGRNATGGNSGPVRVHIGSIVGYENGNFALELFGCRHVTIGSIDAWGNTWGGVAIWHGDIGTSSLTTAALAEDIYISRIDSNQNFGDGLIFGGANQVRVDEIRAFNNGHFEGSAYALMQHNGITLSGRPGKTTKNTISGATMSLANHDLSFGSVAAGNETVCEYQSMPCRASQVYGIEMVNSQQDGLTASSLEGNGHAVADIKLLYSSLYLFSPFYLGVFVGTYSPSHGETGSGAILLAVDGRWLGSGVSQTTSTISLGSILLDDKTASSDVVSSITAVDQVTFATTTYNLSAQIARDASCQNGWCVTGLTSTPNLPVSLTVGARNFSGDKTSQTLLVLGVTSPFAAKTIWTSQTTLTPLP